MLKYFSALLATPIFLSLAPTAYAQSHSPVTVEASAVTSVDYSFYDEFIKRAAVTQGGRPRLAYDFLRKQNQDFVGNYVLRLSSYDVRSLPKNDQLAYWLNLQNIVAIDAILKDGKRKKSLKKLRGTGGEPGSLWTKPRVTVAGKALSLLDIENKILTEFDNPNAIYGIYQGVRGGPSLTSKSYRGNTVEEMLAQNAKRYVNANGIVSVKKDIVRVSPVYFWYKDSIFDAAESAVLEHLKTHAYPTLKGDLYRGKSLKAVSLNYRIDNYEAPSQAIDVNRSRPTRSGYGS